jgi:hypothetical protein
MKPVNYIYIGPSIPSHGLKKNTLYLGEEIPAALKPLIDAYPSAKALFIPTSQLAEANAKITKKGSLENIANEILLGIARR